jgi:hypothetical protein
MNLQGRVVCQGGCHCGAVRFEIEIPAELTAYRCNCSICAKTGFIHLFVESGRFRLLDGEKNLTEYQFHTHTARHLFCRTCGVRSFYVPRSHPDGYSVNLACLQMADEVRVTLADFNGQNWSENIDQLRAGTAPRAAG